MESKTAPNGRSRNSLGCYCDDALRESCDNCHPIGSGSAPLGHGIVEQLRAEAETGSGAIHLLADAADKIERLGIALGSIAERGIYPVNGGHACATCQAFWHPDPAITTFQSEHHYRSCAYVIARDALNEVR